MYIVRTKNFSLLEAGPYYIALLYIRVAWNSWAQVILTPHFSLLSSQNRAAMVSRPVKEKGGGALEE